MATAVNIEVNVDQNGVVSGLGGVKSALNDMAASAEQMAARINAANERVIATFGAVAKAPKAVQESLQFLNSGAAQMEANFSQVAQEVDAVNAKLTSCSLRPTRPPIQSCRRALRPLDSARR